MDEAINVYLLQIGRLAILDVPAGGDHERCDIGSIELMRDASNEEMINPGASGEVSSHT
jgi:hypothetical protein